ncbi:MAG: DUF362 domain-containing protein [Desulfobacterales bacterium]|nr:DUF362 domain-containing protein [Desulfobacterales bacterium]
MKKKVSIKKYEKPFESVKEAITLSNAMEGLKRGDTVYIKPNIVFWSKHVTMPPWGVITTSRVVEDVIALLRDLGAGRIVIGEGTITSDPKDKETSANAYDFLGYNNIAKRYNVEVVNNFERPFKIATADNSMKFTIAADAIDADFVVNLPVLKTHAQTMVSLSQKNLKGCLDMNSRKICHSDNFKIDLDDHIAALAQIFQKKSCAIIDGIYSLERGPAYTGKPIRSDVIIASSDMLLADIVGSAVLGIDPSSVPHIAKASKKQGIDPSIESAELVGEPIKNVIRTHQWDFKYNDAGTLPMALAKSGIEGLYFPKYDHSLCSYCSGIIGLVQMAIGFAWKGIPFNDVEILTGKLQAPSPDREHTILLGKCQVQLNKNNSIINNAIIVPGCPPQMNKLVQGLKSAGIEIDKSLFDNFEMAPAFFMERYKDKPEFSLDFYKIMTGHSDD